MHSFAVQLFKSAPTATTSKVAADRAFAAARGRSLKLILPRPLRLISLHTARPTRPRAPPRGYDMILIVDDYPDSAQAFARLLRKLGYPADAVFSGPDALARVRSHAPEQPLLVVLDEMMPQMSGIEVLRVMRGEPAIAATPVIFFTAGFDVTKRNEAMTLGALAWLYKGATADVQMILTEIARLYESVGGAKQTANAAPRLPPPVT